MAGPETENFTSIVLAVIKLHFYLTLFSLRFRHQQRHHQRVDDCPPSASVSEIFSSEKLFLAPYFQIYFDKSFINFALCLILKI
jgi:hypothetical protein